MLEVKNYDGSWPRKMELILFEYPHTDNTKLWSFDVFDTVGRCRTDKAMYCILFIDTVIQKMRVLFSISITDECRLWRKQYSIIIYCVIQVTLYMILALTIMR